MSAKTRLLLAAILFAVLWTAGMIWWSAPNGMVPIVIWIVSGAIAGALWYWLFGMWYWRHTRPDGTNADTL